MGRVIKFIVSRLKDEAGFGFAELMLSSSVLFMSVLAFTSLMGSSLEFMSTTQAKTIAYNLATEAIEDLKDENYATLAGSPSAIVTSKDGRYSFTRTITVIGIDNSSPADGTVDYKKVTITLTWTKPLASSYTAITYINPYGSVEGQNSQPADIVAPDVRITAPNPDIMVAGTANVQATGTDIFGVKTIEIYIDNVLKKTTTINPVSPGSATDSYTWNSTLVADGIHTIYAKATDAAGNIGTSQSIGYLVINSPSSDNSPPTAPGTLNARRNYSGGLPTNKINLAWSAASDNVGVMGYRVYRHLLTGPQSMDFGYTTSLTFIDTVETTSTVYKYRINAIDGAGNLSVYTNWAIPDDIQSPTTPAGIVVLSQTGNSITFKWTASTDDVRVDRYNIYDNGVLYQTVAPATPEAQTTINYGGGNKDWSFTITAVDDTGFESNVSRAIYWHSTL